jgi:hypothetical protein
MVHHVGQHGADMPSRSAISPTAAGASRQARMMRNRVGSLIIWNISANSTTWSSPIRKPPRITPILSGGCQHRAGTGPRQAMLDSGGSRPHFPASG